MTAPRRNTISSGISGPATASATPRTDPIQKSSAAGPSRAQLAGRWAAYKGAFSGPLSKLPDSPDLNIITNEVAPRVHGAVDFLFGPALKIESANDDQNVQALIDKVFGNEDQRMTMLSRLKINGAVYGHCLVKLVMPKNKRAASIDNPPRLVVQNPELYTIEADPDDCELALRYTCIWPATDEDGNPCERMQTTTRCDPEGWDDSLATGVDDDTHWEIQDWQRADNGQEWQPVGPVMLWPYQYAPIVDWQNFPEPNDHWGTPDVDEGVVNLNRNLHLVESEHNATLYSQGTPILINQGAGDMQGMTPTPGVITDAPGSDVKAIAAVGDPTNYATFASQIRANMDEATSMPGVAIGRMVDLPRGQVSGITMHLLYGPRIMRTEHERRLYGQGIRDLVRLLLLVCGQAAASQEEVQLTWQDALPTDDVAMAQMGLALQQLGFSMHTICSLLGQNYDMELQYKQMEAQDQARMQAAGLANPPVPPGFPSVAGNSAGSGSGATPPLPTAAPGQQQTGATLQPPAAGTGTSGPGSQPPVNHPAAIAQRAAMKAASAKVKLNG
jgi:hypothetical protein